MIEYYIKHLANDSYDVAKFDGGEAPTAVYNLRLTAKKWSCSCPAYTTKKTRPCKHAKMVEQFINRGEQEPLFKPEE